MTSSPLSEPAVAPDPLAPAASLADAAESVTFIHSSDFQIGKEYWFLRGEAQARYAEARNDAIAALGRLATESGAQFIVVAGDVFEYNALSAQAQRRAKEELERLPVPVYLLPGNHDPLVADAILRKVEGGNVHVLDTSEPVEVEVEGGIVELVGAPYLTKRATHDIVAAALEPLEPSDRIRILVGHGQVSSRAAEPAPDVIDLPTVEAALAAGTVDYVALGDTHSTMSLGSTGAVWFSGAPETTDFHVLDGDKGENASGNALVVRVKKKPAGSPAGAPRASVEVDSHRVGAWTFDALFAHANSEDDVRAFLDTLEAYPDKKRTVIKYGLAGTISLSAQQALEDGIARWAPVFAALYERDRTMDLVVEPQPEEIADLGLRGYAAHALEELVEDMAHDPIARDAANLLFRLSSRDHRAS